MATWGGRRFLVLAATLVALLALPWAASAVAAPEDFGRLEVRTTRVQIDVPVDPSAPEGVFTKVAADVYVPVKAGPWPLVQLSHAYPGTLQEFPLSGWASRLASRGFVVIVSDRRGASNLAVTPELDQPSDLIDLDPDVNSEDILRVLRWAIAQSAVPGSLLAGQVDPGRIAIGGHSLGGYLATFAAVKSQSEGPQLSALVLLDPSDERFGQLSKDSSLDQTPSLRMPTIALASEQNTHPIQCNMDDGPDCTLVTDQQYEALSPDTAKYGVKVVGSVHEDVEDPSTIGTEESVAHLRLFQRFGMAWAEWYLAHDCRAAPYLNGRRALGDQEAGLIELFPGGIVPPAC